LLSHRSPGITEHPAICTHHLYTTGTSPALAQLRSCLAVRLCSLWCVQSACVLGKTHVSFGCSRCAAAAAWQAVDASQKGHLVRACCAGTLTSWPFRPCTLLSWQVQCTCQYLPINSAVVMHWCCCMHTVWHAAEHMWQATATGVTGSAPAVQELTSTSAGVVGGHHTKLSSLGYCFIVMG
jgi:hypothetical protein